MKAFTAALALAALFFLPVSLANASMIEEISADSVDTSFNFVASPITDSELKIEQAGVTVVIEKPGNVQEEVSGAFFSVVTYLVADHSTGGKAIGDFAGGAITIKDPLDVLLLSADIDRFSMEESTLIPFTVLAGSGTFHVTGGTWASSFGPEGILFDMTWKLDTGIDSFSEDFEAESNVTLTPIPEPTTMALVALGGVLVALRRKRR